MDESQDITAYKYEVEIEPSDWKYNGILYEAEIAIPGMSERCICHGYPDIDSMKSRCKNQFNTDKLIDGICENGLFKINTYEDKIICTFNGNLPSESIFIILEFILI